jgi:hypothetical protein
MFLNNYNNSCYLTVHEYIDLINLDWNADFLWQSMNIYLLVELLGKIKIKIHTIFLNLIVNRKKRFYYIKTKIMHYIFFINVRSDFTLFVTQS